LKLINDKSRDLYSSPEFMWLIKSLRATSPLYEPLPTTTTGHYTICCKNVSLTLLKMGKNCPKHVELTLEIKLLLLYLVGFSILLYLHVK